ncbi:MAG: ChbG/HpnK family deacetylase [Candidatus Brocadiae bacterium]|nr:ChbG/HpnK family deacetylase [Candidatus Brocadiia bacterium]
MAETRIRLVTRGDDSGSCHTANAAIRDAFEKGILRNTSLMAPCPAFEDAAEMLAGLEGLCVGLHATLNAEWEEVKWGPVLPPERVPSLVDRHGNLFQTTAALHANGPDPDEIMAEIQAQLDLARSRGFDIAYMDCHMGFTWVAEEVADRVAELAEREGLIHRPEGVSGLPRVEGEFDNVVDQVVARLEAAEPGTYMLVGHPGYDNLEMARLGHEGYRNIGRARDWERRMFMDKKVLDCCKANGVEPIRYTEIEGG